MDIFNLAINYIFPYCIFLLFAIYAIKYTFAIRDILKKKKQPFFKLKLFEQIINVEILLLLLCAALIIYFYINNGVINLETNTINILLISGAV